MAQDLLGPYLKELLTCAEERLTHAVGRAFVQAGNEVAHDDCCDGQLWVRVINVAPKYPGNTGATCTPLYYFVTIGLGTIRCASTIDDQGNVPSPETLTAEAMVMTQDMIDLATSLNCCTSPLAVLGNWTPSGPLGGCVGGEWTATIKIDACGC